MGDSIPWWHQRLKGVYFSQLCGIEVCERVKDVAANLIYADPPYIKKTKAYIHDFTLEDHARLAESLDAKREAHVIVSYYEHPQLEELYPASRWSRVRPPARKHLKNTQKGGSEAAPELLLCNWRVEASLFVERAS